MRRVRSLGTTKTLLVTFAVLSFVPLLAFGIVLGRVTQESSEAQALRATAFVQRHQLEDRLWEAMPPLASTTVLGPATAASVDEAVQNGFGANARLVDARLVSVSGLVIWSTDGSAGTSSPVEDFMTMEPSAEVVSIADTPIDSIVRYRLPMRAAASGAALVVLEATVEDAQLVTVIATTSGAVTWHLLVGLGLLWAFLIPVVRMVLGKIWGESEGHRRKALVDPLTGLANRTGLTERGEAALSNALRHEAQVGMVAIDLNQFKHVNDMGGHAVGDSVLIEAAGRLVESTRRGELAVRLGGDEFVVLAPMVSSKAEVEGLASRLRRALEIPVRFADGREVRVTASVGLAMAPSDAMTLDDLLVAADRNMYAEKNGLRRSLEEGGAEVEHRASESRSDTVTASG
ncbi:MAG: GGDEF domain-containing protein [Acidimicrobiia bacterium]|nr:GGDEF domain-containing protein [Acidimicrobiia bacterium]